MIYIVVAVGIFLLDFFLKRYIDRKRELSEETLILKGRVIIKKYYNNGVALDAFEKWPHIIKIVCGIILIVLCGVFGFLLRQKGNPGLKLGLAMVIGGGANNLCDRFMKGHVVDYFSFKSRFPKIQRVIFNISDMFIFLGSLMVVIFHRK